MKLVCIPHNNIPCKNLGGKIDYSMTDMSYMKDFYNSNNGSRGSL